MFLSLAFHSVSGLSNSAVLRLKWTRLKLPKQITKSLEELEELTNMEGSYRNFRRELEHVVLPCLPYVGVYLMDLTFIEDGNPDIKGTLINWEKRKLVNNIIGQIQKFQLTGYNLQRDDKIQSFFTQAFASCAGLTDRDLYAKSLEYEPRNAQRADIK
jgi:son of sevenless